MKSNIVYVADIADDIDDMVAIFYLASIGRLKCVVLDGKKDCPERVAELRAQNIDVVYEIPDDTSVVFCGGALTPIREYLEKGFKLSLLVVNGFFAGSNVVDSDNILSKFKNRKACPSYNPNLDPESAIKVLMGDIETILVVSKNVCHHPDNVIDKWHTENIFKTLDISPTKKLHDVLMVKEGLNLLDGEDMLCEYVAVNIYSHGEGTHLRQWSSELNHQSNILISIKKYDAATGI